MSTPYTLMRYRGSHNDKCDKGAEYEEIIEREAPDLNIFQRRKLEPGAGRLLTASAAFAQNRIVRRGEPKNDSHQRNADGPNLSRHLPAIGDENEWREELGDRGAHVAGAENSKRGALLFGRIPARHVGDADREGTARDADAERRNQHLGIGLSIGKHERCHGRRQHGQGVDKPAAVLIGPDTERQPNQGACQNRRADEQAELRFVESQLVLDADADDGEDRPHREADRERNCRKPECTRLSVVCHGPMIDHDFSRPL